MSRFKSFLEFVLAFYSVRETRLVQYRAAFLIYLTVQFVGNVIYLINHTEMLLSATTNR